ncbi:MAG: Holliday junction branch migration protein RuvA [Patescibacteria group bacterium]
MIGYLQGKLISKTDKTLLIDVNGVGYTVFTTSTFSQKNKAGENITVYTHLDFNERSSSLDLFGLSTFAELEFFKKMITISGVGPKTALGVFEVAKLDDIQKAISKGDPSLLTKVSGIGKKTAELIIIKLKDKTTELNTDSDGLTSHGETLDALVSLGYPIATVREILNKLPPEITSTEDKIKAALKLLGK